MFNPQPKPQFHTYPLRTSQLSKLNQQMSQLDQQIYQNCNQIQQIRQKFQNQQYQNAYIQRLMEKNKILQLKKEEFDYINKMHQYHQVNEDQEKKISLKMHGNLATQYKQQIEDNRRRKSLEKQQERNRDKQMMDRNQQQIQRIQMQKQRNLKKIEHYNVLDNRAIQHHLTYSNQKQRQQQKTSFQQKLAKNNLQVSDKQVAFGQFYKSTKKRQQTLQRVYNTSTQPINSTKKNQRDRVQKMNQLQYMQSMQRRALQQQQRKATDTQQLKEYLQRQMQYNIAKRHQQHQHTLLTDANRQLHQVNNHRYNLQQKQKTKLQQHLYSHQLSRQFNQQQEIQKQNSQRNKRHNYLNQSSQAIITRKEAHSPESPNTGIFLGNQKGRFSVHNPLNNPVPFSIGMTNPYVLKQYEEKRLSNTFAGSNLAKLAQNSFIN